MSQTPRSFRPYDRPDDDAGPDTKTRRMDSPTAPPAGDDTSWRDMVGGAGSTGSFRAERGRTTTSRPTGAVPALNSQRMTRWLQDGGWKMVAGVAGVFLLLLIFLLVRNRPGGEAQIGSPTAAPVNNGASFPDPNIPTQEILIADPNAVVPTQAPAQTQPDQPPPAASGARFAITGTGTEGLFLRDAPGGTILKTMPEGTAVEKLGEQTIDGLLWFNVREPGGLEGWSASTYMVQAP